MQSYEYRLHLAGKIENVYSTDWSFFGIVQKGAQVVVVDFSSQTYASAF